MYISSSKRTAYITSLIILVITLTSSPGSAFQSDPVEQLKNFSNAFIRVAEQISPKVVRIEVLRKAAPANSAEELFRRRYGGRGQQEYSRGLGSGVIIDPEGYIITNNHVIEGALEVDVVLTNKYRYEADVVGADPLTDVALIKIKEPGSYPYANLGNSDNLKVGEWVIAIGSPQNLTNTVTKGIVSAIGRDMNPEGGYTIENFIQTDAAINRGNSGGPLVNLDGEVIGINTAIISETGTFTGYGFAIPVNLARNIAADLRKHGRVVRGVMGVTIINIADQEHMKQLKVADGDGVVINGFNNEVTAGKDAGLRENDVIVKINDVPIQRVNQLQERVSGSDPGDRLKLTVMRNGDPRDIWVTLEPIPEETIVQNGYNFNVPIMNMSIEMVTYAQGSSRETGIRVTSVIRNGVADRNGIKPGDIIYKIETMEIKQADDFRDALQRYGDRESILFYIRNNEGTSLLNVKIDK